MFWWTIQVFTYAFLCLLGIYAVREVICLINLYAFKKQGVKTFWYPFVGAGYLFARAADSKDTGDRLRAFINSNKEEDVVAVNCSEVGAMLILSGGDTLREFFVKEREHTIKHSIAYPSSTFGLFFGNGPIVDEYRALYANFFNFDNIHRLSKQVTAIVDQCLQEFKRKNFSKERPKKTVDLDELTIYILLNIVDQILMGQPAQEKPLENDGKSFGNEAIDYVDALFDAAFNIPNLLSIGYLNYLRISRKSRNADTKFKELEEKCFEKFKQREKEGPRKTLNIMDMLVEHSKEKLRQGQSGLSPSEVSGNMILFQLAGSDTARGVSNNATSIMAKRQDVQAKMREFADSIFGSKPLSEVGYDDYNTDPVLETYIQEFMRMGSPLGSMAIRKTVKDFKLGKVSVKKGTLINIMGTFSSLSNKFFEDGRKFDLEKYSKEALRTAKFGGNIPFSSGRRICIGKELGNIMVRNILLQILRHFTISEDPVETPKGIRDWKGFYQWKDLKLVFEVRK